jgi:hypothetical protein
MGTGTRPNYRRWILDMTKHRFTPSHAPRLLHECGLACSCSSIYSIRFIQLQIEDVIANELAKSTPFNKYHFSSTLVMDMNDEPTKSTTPAAYDLFMELQEDSISTSPLFTLYLWLTEWRDDFDPNNTKSSRNQVWINTFTICPPPKESTGKNTYFMALSSKGDDHSEVESLFEAELQSLGGSNNLLFYHGGLKKLIPVKVGKLSTCIDRPERRSMFQVGDHNGTYSTYWGHACNVWTM